MDVAIVFHAGERHGMGATGKTRSVVVKGKGGLWEEGESVSITILMG